MKTFLLTLCIAASALPLVRAQQPSIANPLIDYPGFRQDVSKVEKLRGEHRVTEQQFIEMSKDPDTVILDARSTEKFDLLHIRGAKHLSLPDVTAAELAKVIPAKTTRILIYCNNNFLNDPVALPSKAVRASLNIYTFNTLYSYGYQNVYELGPLLDIKKSILPFEGTEAVQLKPQAANAGDDQSVVTVETDDLLAPVNFNCAGR